MTYHPKLNDFVSWKHIQGWVYYIDQDTLSIEINTYHKKHPVYVNQIRHQKDHVLVVCPRHCWHELTYIKSRESKHDD